MRKYYLTDEKTKTSDEEVIDLVFDKKKIDWKQWSVKNKTEFSSNRRGIGSGEEKLSNELLLNGMTKSFMSDGNSDYDIATDIGTFEVKAPDSSGRILTASKGYEAYKDFMSECSSMFFSFEPLLSNFKEEFVDMFVSNKNKFDKGNFTGNTIQFIGNVIEMLSEIIEEEKNKMQVTAIHEWLSDTSVFYSDALVFPSECISADYIALVCEEGYALLSRFDADNIFNFQGDVWGGRPKFFSEQATKKNRNKVLQTKKRNKKLDKIKTIENLQKKGRWI